VNSDPVLTAIAGCADSHRHLLAGLVGLTDELVPAPSLLPDWTIGHVVTHLARNADGLTRMLEGGERDEVAEMYPGGVPARALDIETGAVRSAAALCEDLRTASDRLDHAFANATDAAWDRLGRMITREVALRELPELRRREVEIHRVDLGLGYTFADWPADYRRAELARLTGMWASRKPMGFTDLPVEALALSPADRLAWLVGRLDVPGLAPAGIF
jgi:maleylpyruvate isomerase